MPDSPAGSPTVMILEPDPLQRDLYAAVLLRNGFKPILCLHPTQAAELLAEHVPDLMVINILLPGQNGFDLLADLKSQGRLGETKIIVVSPLGFPEIVQKAARAGVAAFMVKPVDPGQLIHRARQLVGFIQG
jgi:DNA-binding response OmpR family regulator